MPLQSSSDSNIVHNAADNSEQKAATIKTITPSPPVTSVPDLKGRPGSIKIRQAVTIKGLGKLVMRPIQRDDEEEMLTFHQHISEESIYMRYFEYLGLDQRTSHDRLVRICTNTHESYAIVLEADATLRQVESILAVGRLTTNDKPYEVSFDTLITTEKKGPQLAKALLSRLITLARAFGFQTLTGELLVADHDTLNLCRSLKFSLQTVPEDGLVRVTLGL